MGLVILALVLPVAPIPAAAGPVARADTMHPRGITEGPNRAPRARTSDDDPTSQELIDQDLRDDAIDYGVSLVYRAWALFWDERLPRRYDGSGSTGEDPFLLTEIEEALPGLPADQQAELEGFLARPTNPASPFGPQPAGMGASETQEDETKCVSPNGWFAKDWSPDNTNDTGFRAWACAESRQAALPALDTVLGIGSSLWPPMTIPEPNGMGPPVPDTTAFPDNDGNGKIDVYVLNTADCRDRQGRCEEIAGGAIAAAVRSKPCTVAGFPPLGCSGYLLLSGERLSELDELKVDFAHEFFHVLQFAHSGIAHFRNTGLGTTGHPIWDQSWYMEASATWAAWYYVRDGARPRSYERFRRYQTNNKSLLLYEPLGDPPEHQYQSWAWPLFQFAERGSDNVFRTWQVAEGATNPEQLDAAVAIQLPFEELFRDFAVRNLQPREYRPPTSTGLEDDWWRTHPALLDFPLTPHKLTNRGRLVQGNARRVRTRHDATIQALAAQYDRFIVTDPKVRQIEIDVGGLRNAETADLDVVGRLNGDPHGPKDPWSRISASGPTLTLCRDTPQEDFNLLHVVISNHSSERNLVRGSGPSPDAAVKGRYTITTKNMCDVPIAYEGTFSGSADFSWSRNTWEGTARFEYINSARSSCDPPASPPTAHDLRHCYRFAGGEATWSADPWEDISCSYSPLGPVHVNLQPHDYPFMELVQRDEVPEFVNSFFILVGPFGEVWDATMQVERSCNGFVSIQEIRFSSSGGNWIYTPGINYIGEGWQLVANPMLEHQSWSFNFQPIFDE
ncbi:MAG TPA: hypothetical protein VIC58_06775 [Actinomycetota bacterium]